MFSPCVGVFTIASPELWGGAKSRGVRSRGAIWMTSAQNFLVGRSDVGSPAGQSMANRSGGRVTVSPRPVVG